MAKSLKSLSRAQLYEMAWTEPLSKLAPRLGLSDVGLAKILDRMEVPRPAVGHWIKKEHGKAAARPALPPAKAGIEKSVRLRPKLAQEASVALDSGPKVKVSKRLSNPHPLVRAAEESFAQGRPDLYGRLSRRNVLAMNITTSSLRRALRLMDAAIKTLEERGHSVMIREERWSSGSCAVVAGQRVSFELKEAVKRVPHKHTPNEISGMRRFGGYWGSRYDYEPTGRLTLAVEGGYSRPGVKRSWRDTARRKLEDQVGEFIVAVESIGEEKRRYEEELERRRQREAEERARIAEEQERRRHEAEREARLVDLSREWRTATDLREFLAELERRAQGNEGAAEVIAWGMRVADKLDPLSRDPEDVFARVEVEEASCGSSVPWASPAETRMGS